MYEVLTTLHRLKLPTRATWMHEWAIS